MNGQRESRSAWPRALGPLLILVALLALYWPSVASVAERWAQTKSQGALGFFFVILVYLSVRRWRLEGCPLAMRPRVGALLLLALLSVAWALAGLGHMLALQDLAFFLMLVPSLWLILGYRLGTRHGLPLVLMLTAITLWDVLSPMLQEITTAASVPILNGLGISSVREGLVIMVPAGDFVVNSSCSGIKQVTSAFAITILYAYLERLSLLGSVVLLSLSWLAAITSNVLRVVIIVAAGQATEMQHSLIHEHSWLGWVIFGIAIMALLLLVGRRLPQADEAEEAATTVSARTRDLGVRLGGRFASFGVAVLVALSIGPLLATVAAAK